MKKFREKEEDIEQLDTEADADVKIVDDAAPPVVEDTVSQVLKHIQFITSRFFVRYSCLIFLVITTATTTTTTIF